MEETNGSCVTILFENNDKAQFNKEYLIKHSLYFEAMFCGNFMESKSGDQIQLKDINMKGFMSVISSLKIDDIVSYSLEDLLLLLETSQLLQFTEIIKKSIERIIHKDLLSTDAIPIFSFASGLGLKELCEKARLYILYHFKNILVLNKKSFFELNEDDFLQLLNDHRLNVDNEMDIFNLVVEWCSETNNRNKECEIAISCLHFNAMNIEQLKHCILKTNNLNLQITIKKYIDYIKKPKESLGLLIKTPRSVPHDLFTIQMDYDGHATIYRWDWTSLNFIFYVKVDPLPPRTFGYTVVVHELEIYVLIGEYDISSGNYNNAGWKYNLLSKQWKKLDGFTSSRRTYGMAQFCNNTLYLFGGFETIGTHNQLVESFIQRKNFFINIFKQGNIQMNNSFDIDKKSHTYFTYKNQIVLISKESNPTWFGMCPDSSGIYMEWKRYSINLRDTVINAGVYHDYIYIYGYNILYAITLYRLCPTDKSCEVVKQFKTVYYDGCTRCIINNNKAMIFHQEKLEYYCLDSKEYKEYTTHKEFESNLFFSIPYYCV